MDDDELIKEIPRNEEEGIIKTLEENDKFDIKKILIIGTVIAVFLIAIIIVLITSSKKKNNNSENKSEEEKEVDNTPYGIIRCLYQVQTTKSSTQIISKEFKQTEGVNVYINGNKSPSIYEYQFESLGLNEVNITIPNNFDMKNMFSDLNNLKSVSLISEKNGKIISMESTFENCNNLNYFEIKGFDTSELKSLKRAFYGTDFYDVKTIDLNTQSVEDMSYMFAYSQAKEMDLSKLTTDNLKDMSYMFYQCQYLTSLDLKNFTTGKVINMSHTFSSCLSLTSIDLSRFDTSNVEDMSGMFRNDISFSKLDLNFETSKVTNMSRMFQDCISLDSLNIKSFKTSNVISMSYMFSNCNSLKTLDLSHFNTDKVTDMSNMF